MKTDQFNVAYSLEMQAGSGCGSSYEDNYCVAAMSGCYMLFFRCVINYVSNVFLTHVSLGWNVRERL